MKKSGLIDIFDVIKFKFDLKMKLTVLFLLISLFRINANTYSQNTKVSLNLKDTSIEKVFNEIEKKTEFNFFYKNSTINLSKKISIKVEKQNIKKILDYVLANSNLSYEVFNKQIIILTKETKPIPIEYKNSDKKLLQQKQISGTITDENNNPLAGATVIIKGKNIGTSTDIDGKYSLTLPTNATTLVITYIGYKTVEVAINDRANIDVQLEVSNAELDEVVLIGYGKAKKENLTGAVGVVNIKAFENQAPTISADRALQGQVAGVFVSSLNGQIGAASKIRIRGTTSLTGSNQPLFVIDGIPLVPESNIPIAGNEGRGLSVGLNDEGLSTPLANINQSDIESISVLKDASAAAIYGSRAANGVIIITTKKGKLGKPKFNFEVSTSVMETNTLDVLNASQFKEAWTTAAQNTTRSSRLIQAILDGSYFGTADTNWEALLSPSSPVTTKVDLSVRGKKEDTDYSVSLSALNAKTTFSGSEAERLTFNLNLNTEFTSKWKFGTSLQTSFFDQSAVDPVLLRRIYNYRPDISAFDENGDFSASSTNFDENPVALSRARNKNKTFLFLGTFYTKLELFKGLNAETRLSVNYNNGNQQSFYPKFTIRGGWSAFTGDGDGFAQDGTSNRTTIQWQSTLTYDKLFNDVHDVNAVVGTTFEESKTSFNKAFGTGFPNDALVNISSATVSSEGSSGKTASGLASYFGRINYNYDQKYLFTLTGRLDGSSKFAKENKYAFFPAAAVAWRISQEDFLVDSDFFDELKLRASLGKTGQQDFGPYQWRTLYETNNYGGDASIILSQLGNDRLKWETTNQLDFGVNFSILKNKISGEFGYYQKKTEDVIFPVIAPGNTGVSRVLANVGNTKNSGVEFQLNVDLIKSKDFSWDVSLNATRNKNLLTKISEDFKNENGILTGIPGQPSARLKEGQPIGLILGHVVDGIFQEQSEIDALNSSSPTGIYQNVQTSPGDFKFRDVSGPNGTPDGRIDNFDQQVIGDNQPDVYGGFVNVFRYKNFTLSAQFTYSIGNDLYWFAQAQAINFVSPFLGENKLVSSLNGWTPQNPTNQPRIVFGDPNLNSRTSSYYVYDASYLKLSTLNFKYNVPEKLIKKINFIDNVSIFAIAQNVLTVTKYPGADPETGTIFNNDLVNSFDNNRFPLQRSYTFGLRVGF